MVSDSIQTQIDMAERHLKTYEEYLRRLPNDALMTSQLANITRDLNILIVLKEIATKVEVLKLEMLSRK